MPVDFNVLAVDIAAEEAAAQFAASLHETGFAVLTGHPISAGEIARMYGEWAEFFAGESRFNYAAKQGQSDGYFGFKSENAKDSPYKDLKEFFHVYQDCTVPPEMEQNTRAFFDKLIELGTMLLGWLDHESPSEVQTRYSEPLTNMIAGSTHNLLRNLHSPPLPDDVIPGEVRAAAHEDINLITLLVAGSEPGLEARDMAGNWHKVPSSAGMIVVNSGDMLAKASGGYYPSTSHRVVNPPRQQNRSRYSMPMFVHPRSEVRLDADYTAGEYLNERLHEIGLK